MIREILLIIIGAFLSTHLHAQHYDIEKYGYRHLYTVLQGDTVDLVVHSKPGEEKIVKPVIIFGVGSTPRPILFLNKKNQVFGAFPFQTAILLDDYHLVVADKPYIPWIYSQEKLENNQYRDPETGLAPVDYSKRDYVDYYVRRYLRIIDFLKTKTWVAKDRLILAGHSASSTVMAKVTVQSGDVTHFIYSNGNPYGRMISMISMGRADETRQNPVSERLFKYWQEVVNHPQEDSSSGGDTNKATYTFSIPPYIYLEKIDIPVLVTYGSKDRAALFNDLFRLNIIKQGKKNFSFIPYMGVGHNYFGFTETGEIDDENFGWDSVALDWLKWLKDNDCP